MMTTPTRGLAPFSLKDVPAMIERVFPAQKVGIEAQKERKAGAGQTLTALGSYWKGRKPLVLVRACVLASLLPATNDPAADLELFEMLMRMDPEGISRRDAKVTAQQVANCGHVSEDLKDRHLVRRDDNRAAITAKWKRIAVSATRDERARFDGERETIRQQTLAAMSFSQQVGISERVERLENLTDEADPLYAEVLDRTNARLGTDARTLPLLVEQLGKARFGHRPVVGDPFAGGGSIPFESARVGCDVVASDLNPVAAMLTWGALNIIGADETRRAEIAAEQARVAAAVDAEITQLGVEHKANGDRAKAYLYCLETVDPQTGWRIPMAPSWVISRNRRCVARMVPIYAEKRFDLQIVEDASSGEMAAAEIGTVRDGYLIYRLSVVPGGDEEEHRIAIARLRGDGEGPERPGGGCGNRLRPWSIADVAPNEPRWNGAASPVVAGSAPGAWVGGDILLERLYCIQWMDGADLKAGKSRARTFFRTPGEDDVQREEVVRNLVESNLAAWQEAGLVPDMPIEAGVETTRLIRERGWTFWHHLFGIRHILILSIYRRYSHSAAMAIAIGAMLNHCSRLCSWKVGFQGSATVAPSADQPVRVFYNQALNTNFTYVARSAVSLSETLLNDLTYSAVVPQEVVENVRVAALSRAADLWIFDPPYADAVHYHEITEFFIAWLRKNPPAPFDRWTWDSRRPFAIKGKDEKFRSDMTDAFRVMRDQMPDNGMQVCMFTHQDASVWADMAGIVWGAGLRVTAAWYVSTETTSELKKGGYVQGTVLLVLRKRVEDAGAYGDELIGEVRDAVTRQVNLLTGLNQSARAKQRSENPFGDQDIGMAGYAAALEVLTRYTHVDGIDMTREALKPRVKGKPGLVERMIDMAVQTATEMMLPESFDQALWARLGPLDRFWLKMTEAEAISGQVGGKVDPYQNFAKAYRADGWEDLMADRTATKARLKSAAEFKRALMSGHAFAEGTARPVLYAIAELQGAADSEEDHKTAGDRVLAGLRNNLQPWAQRRQQAVTIAEWIGRTVAPLRPKEASAARTLAALIKSERLN